MKKKILFLSILQCFLIFHAKAEVIASGDNCGDNCHWEYDNTTKTLSFTGTGAMYNYTTSQDVHDKEGQEWVSNRPWINYISEIKNIEIGEGITHTGKYLCAHCTVLETISFPNTMEGIDLDSFWDTNIQDIAIPSSIQYINHEAFLDSKNIQNIYCPKTKKDYCENALAESNSRGNLTIYEKNADGLYLIGHKTYANFNDLRDGKYIRKRIYTIDEANKVSGKKNTFKIRYK